MYAGGGTTTTAALAGHPPPPSPMTTTKAGASTSTHAPRRSKPPPENWDDDFEFSFAKPSSSSSKTNDSTSRPQPLSTPKRTDGDLRSRGSNTQLDSPDSFDEDWDDPLPAPTPPQPRHSALSASRPALAQRSPVPSHLQPPRSSQSHSPTLPSPTSSTSSYAALKQSAHSSYPLPTSSALPPNGAGSSGSLGTVRTGNGAQESSYSSGFSTPRGQLSKRSSTAFPPSRESPLTGHSSSPAHRSSPNLAASQSNGSLASLTQPRHQTSHSSLKRVPVPPIPAGIDHTRAPSPTKSRRSPGGTARSSPFQPSAPGPAPTSVQTITASPSSENLRGEKKKKSLWKRFSGGPSTPPDQHKDSRRRRSSSVGNLLPPDAVQPPVPPLPANLRSPSGTSGWSTSSIVSSPGSGKSSTGKMRRFSNMMRRSSSNISALADSPSKPPPLPSTAHVLSSPSTVKSSSAANLSPQLSSSSQMHRMAVTSRSPVGGGGGGGGGGSSDERSSRPRTFSPGFHLPMSSPGSPYNRIHRPGTGSDSDTETEEGETSSRRRRRVRPASAMPIPRKTGPQPLQHPEANSSTPSLASSRPSSSAPRNVHMPTLQALSGGAHPHNDAHSRGSSANMPDSASAAPLSSSPSTTSLAMSLGSSAAHGNGDGSANQHHQSTFQRLTTFSRRHSRRFSGGWFGTQSSASSNESRPPLGAALETVHGSPSKPDTFSANARRANRMSADLPSRLEPDTDTFPPATTIDLSSPRANRVLPHSSMGPPRTEAQTDWEDTAKMKQKKERRRMSADDWLPAKGGGLAIPPQLLAKQNGYRRDKGAVLKINRGAESLKQLLASHDRVCEQMVASGSAKDMQLFCDLEEEYSQWWEMATVLIDVIATQPQQPSEVRSRRITLATDDSRVTSEALRSVSNSTARSFATTATSFSTSTSTSKHTFMRKDSDSDIFSSQPSSAADYRASTGRGDLSKRQLDMLRSMLQNPRPDEPSAKPFKPTKGSRASMPVPPTTERPIIPAASSTMRASHSPLANNNASTPVAAFDSPWVIPSPQVPSPHTAAALAPQTQRVKTGIGLSGLKSFLRSLKGGNNTAAPVAPATPSAPPPNKLRKRPAPINAAAAKKYAHHSNEPVSPIPPTSKSGADAVLYQTQRSAVAPTPIPSAIGPISGDGIDDMRSPVKMEPKKRRPSIKNIFRPTSGNWVDLVRSTPPPSPLAMHLPQLPDVDDDVVEPHEQPAPTSGNGHGLSRPPSLPALARLKSSGNKTPTYSGLGIDGSGSGSGASSPTRPSRRGTVGASETPPLATVPGTPGSIDSEATLRLKSRVRGLGLGHPSEASPSRASSSPAKGTGSGGSGDMLAAPPEAPRSRSEGGMDDGGMIWMTPDNVPVFLEYVRQCERRLEEWRVKAGAFEGGDAGGERGSGSGSMFPM